MVQHERQTLTDAEKQFYREVIDLPLPAWAMAYPPGTVDSERKQRFFVFQCQFCGGIHTGACPKVKSRRHYESGAVREVVFFPDGEWDDSAVIWFEDVFDDGEADAAEG